MRADLGPPLIDEVLRRQAGRRARACSAGDRIVAIDGDAGALAGGRRGDDQREARRARSSFRVARDGAERDVAGRRPRPPSRAGARVGIAGVRLKVDPAVAERARGRPCATASVEALVQGARKTWELSVFTLKMLGRIVTGDASLKNISGPITMADFAGQSAQAGMLVFVGYLALISISLGVLNLLPVPLLDGGHLLYYFAEIIKGSPVSDRAFEVGQRIGMAVLAVLMALALFNDVSRLF